MKQNLGTMIAELRKEQGMTQAQLAEKMGVTDKAVSKWERNLSCPDVASFPKLAEIFQISVDELMQGQSGEQTESKKDRKPLVAMVCKGVALAMGITVTVLSVLKQIDLYSGFSMLGIGLAAAGITLLQSEDENH